MKTHHLAYVALLTLVSSLAGAACSSSANGNTNGGVGAGDNGGAGGVDNGGAGGGHAGGSSSGEAGANNLTDAARPDAGPYDANAPLDATADAASTIAPTMVNGHWRFSWNTSFFEVDAATGARIVAFGRDATNLLTGPDVNPDNWGSTFWPSPQNNWHPNTASPNWPPPVEIDNQAYTIVTSTPVLTVLGATNDTLGLRARKTFLVDAANDVVHITYALETDATTPTMAAPWEVTRALVNGVAFCGLGAGGDRGGTLTLDKDANVVWLTLNKNTIPGKQFIDGKGWLAYADATHRLLFVKRFPDIAVADFAPGEAEVELFVDSNLAYIELESQGAIAAISKSQPLTWPVSWMIRPIPANVDISAKSASLLSLTMNTLGL